MFEPPLLNQALGTGAVILGFISAGILAHQLEKQKRKKDDFRKNKTRKTSEILIKSLRWGVILNVRKSVRIFVVHSLDLPMIMKSQRD